jgi:nucleoside-diphosphate-sugar epimerase
VAVVLLLGARGFLGSEVARALRASDGVELVEADLPGVGGGGSAGATGTRFVPVDLLGHPVDLAASLAGIRPDAIVNCAGRTAGDEAELRAANVVAVERLLVAIRATGLGPRLVHIGSAAEYGAGETGRPVAEDAATKPLGPYGATKLAGTRLVAEARRRGLVDAVVLRVFNAVGPGMPADSLPGAALRRLAAALSSGSERVEMGPLDAVRDFVDTRDVSSAVAAACRAPAPPPILNVGTGRPSTARELVEAIARRMGFDGSIEESSPGSRRSGYVAWMVADVAAATRHLDWRASHDLGSIAAALVPVDGR